jgi:Glycosyltransferase family 87
MESNQNILRKYWAAVFVGIMLMVGISWLRYGLIHTMKVDNEPFPVEWNYPVFILFIGSLLLLAFSYWKIVWTLSPSVTKRSYKVEAYLIVILSSMMLPFLSNDVFVYLGHGYLSNQGVDVFSHTNILKSSIWISYIDAWPDGPFVYGPINLIPSKIANWIGGENIWLTFISYKIFTLLVGFGIVELLTRMVKHPKDLLIAIIAPSFWLHNIGHMHNDMIAALFIMASVLFILKNQLILSAIFIGLSLSCKVSSIVYIPFIFCMYYFTNQTSSSKKWGNMMVSFLVLMATIVGCYGIFYTGSSSLTVPFNYLAQQNAAKSFAEILGEILNVVAGGLSPEAIESEVSMVEINKTDPKVYWWGISQKIFNLIGLLLMFITSLIFAIKTKMKFNKELTIEYFIKISFIFFFIYLHIFQAWYLILLMPMIVISQNNRIKRYFMVLCAYSGIHTIIYVIARPSALFYLVPVLVLINASLFLWQFRKNYLSVESPIN